MKVWTVLIIGSGFGGQCAAINLLRQGIADFRLLERRAFAGGTWCQNSYPGAAVDVQSPLYSIASEPWDWTQMFAEQSELETYTRHILAKYDLVSRTELNTNVEAMTWNDAENLWEVTTSRGVFRSRFVVNASGPLSNPVIPAFPGRDSFAGKTFHTNGWDHGYDLRGKRVAIIGSGASAAQVIPAIAPEVGHLHVFQRTPHWVMPRPDHVFSTAERALLRRRPAQKALRSAIYWGLETRVIAFKHSRLALKHVAEREARRHLAAQVKDPVLRDRLTPDFTIGCKRIILSNTLYPALCRPNVTLYTRDEGIASINPAGILTRDGRQVDLDLIVWSTGYDATDGAIPYPVTGRDGKTLKEAWHEFPRAYLGTAMPGFPNLFVVTGPNTGIGHTSAIFIIEAQMQYIMDSIVRTRQHGHQRIEVTAAAEERYTRMIHREMEKTVWKTGGCNSWYQSRSGHVIAMFPGFSFSFRRMTGTFRTADHRFA
jgi:cation diffusion facilitator CzcD-associated flavoprotein CzcO